MRRSLLSLALFVAVLAAAPAAQAADTFAFCGGSWRCNVDRKVVSAQNKSFAKKRTFPCSKGGCYSTVTFRGTWRTVGDVRWVMAKLREHDSKWDYYVVGANYTARVACKKGVKCSSIAWNGYRRLPIRVTRNFPQRQAKNFRPIDWAPHEPVNGDCKTTSFGLSAGPLSVPFSFRACDEIRSEGYFSGPFDSLASVWHGRTRSTRNAPLTIAFKVRSSLRRPSFTGSVRNPFGRETRWRISLGSA